MRYGLNLRPVGRLVTIESYVHTAELAERLAFDTLWHFDHVVIPKVFDQSRYRQLYGGEFPLTAEDPFFEPITTLAFLAGKVNTPRLGLAVLVVPYRNPVLTAKMLSNLDVISGGRLIVGVGAGWTKEEFEILHCPPYEARGSVTNEYLDICIELWTKEEPTYHGKHYQVSNVGLQPKPVQKPYPPIWVGGNTLPAFRRVARYGRGWLPLALTPQQVADKLPVLRRVCVEAGRNPDEIEVCTSASIRFSDGSNARGSERQPFSGTPQQIVDDIHRCQEIGVAELRLTTVGADLNEVTQTWERFANEVRPKV
jgi:probable F420-dependent oxidoreductase